jgi:fatty-acyl-CoA synthase
MTDTGLLWPDHTRPDDLELIEKVPLEDRPLPSSTYDALRRTAAELPDATALLVLPDGKRWQAPVETTYAELLDRVHREANLLAALGVGRTDAVGLLSVNTGGLVSALLAAEAVGIAAPVNPALRHDHVAGLLQRAGARVLIASGPELEPQVWELARRLAGELRMDALLALRPTGAAAPAPELDAVEGVTVAYLDDAARARDASRLAVPEPAPDHLAAFFHTGGTTGTPKLAAHTHRMQVVDAWAVALIGPADPTWTVFAALPLFHVNALVVTTLAPLLRGHRVVWGGPLGYRDLALVRSFWQVVERYGIAAMSAVPAVYAGLSGVPVDADISTLSLAIVGAAPRPQAVRDAWLTHTGMPLTEGYGLTEATCATARSFPGSGRPGTVGQRLPYQQVATVSADPSTGAWRFLGPDEVGTLAISGPTVFPGYVVGRDQRGPVLDAGGKVRDGWLDTGDLGTVSADGFVSLTGHAKDLIIRGGHNIDPAAVEAVFREHPAVVDAGVVGRPDRHSGEVPQAFVVLRDETVDPEEIRAWAASRVPEPAAAPRHVTVLPVLPVTAVGKPYKLGLRVIATREELTEALADAGVPVPPDETWCDQQDGRVTVVLPAPPAEGAHTAAAAVLDSYALDWRFA